MTTSVPSPASTPAPAPGPDVVALRTRSFVRGMIGIEIFVPALLVLVGVIMLVAAADTVVRSFGLALLLPGIALAIGAIIRIVGLELARRAFRSGDRPVSLQPGRRLSMIGLAVGVLAAIVSIVVASTISWLDAGAGFITIFVAFFVIVLTVGLSITEFRAEGTVAKATRGVA